jgi:hypothetical protein
MEQPLRLLVIVLLSTVAVLTGIWGGWLLIDGAFGRSTEDLGPAFFMVIGGALLAVAAALGCLAYLTAQAPGTRWQLVLVVLVGTALGFALLGVATGAWLAMVVLLGLVVAAAAFSSRGRVAGSKTP